MNEYKGYVSGYPRYDNSYEYFYKASLSNHPTAMFMIAFMYINKLIGSGHKQELNIAYDYLKKAINKGSIAALNTLGLMYLNGIYPLEKDKDKGITMFCFLWLKKIGKIPNIVAKPAKLVIIKLIIIEFIVNYMKKKRNNAKTLFFIFLITSFQSLE